MKFFTKFVEWFRGEGDTSFQDMVLTLWIITGWVNVTVFIVKIVT